MSLKDRCVDFVHRVNMNAMLRQNSPVDDLVSFVVTEIGRAADERFDNSVPLALYFSTEEDRAEFLEAVKEAKPGMISRHWP